MRHRSILPALLVLAVVGTVASAAVAAPLGFTGELQLSISGLDPITVAGGGVATVEPRAGDADHLAALRLESSAFRVDGLVIQVTDPAAHPIFGVQATARNGAGSFAEVGGVLGGTLPVLGAAKVCLFGNCDQAVANLAVPLSVVGGPGGTAVVGDAVNLTVVGAPWTTGTAAIGTITTMGFARGPGAATSSTLAQSGTVRLVTPVFISTSIGALPTVPAFAFLTLHFVPEPGTVALVGLGLAGLVAAGARRARH